MVIYLFIFLIFVFLFQFSIYLNFIYIFHLISFILMIWLEPETASGTYLLAYLLTL